MRRTNTNWKEQLIEIPLSKYEELIECQRELNELKQSEIKRKSTEQDYLQKLCNGKF